MANDGEDVPDVGRREYNSPTVLLFFLIGFRFSLFTR